MAEAAPRPLGHGPARRGRSRPRRRLLAALAPADRVRRAGSRSAVRRCRRRARLAAVPRRAAHGAQRRTDARGAGCGDLRRLLRRAARNALVDRPGPRLPAGGRGRHARLLQAHPAAQRQALPRWALVGQPGGRRSPQHPQAGARRHRARVRPVVLPSGRPHRAAIRERRADRPAEPQAGVRRGGSDPRRHGGDQRRGHAARCR